MVLRFDINLSLSWAVTNVSIHPTLPFRSKNGSKNGSATAQQINHFLFSASNTTIHFIARCLRPAHFAKCASQNHLFTVWRYFGEANFRLTSSLACTFNVIGGIPQQTIATILPYERGHNTVCKKPVLFIPKGFKPLETIT
ncbi:Uncharacterized protein APZ42_004999 [Daphnia magna]|uniref:Uncharacterized protein n=1 Tax=Daphnia magna TaxID=35525 RepID=A0A164GQB5_9CRUS|nr:Uncharacterized protein APZ42_004999 [Daphnia magna]